MGIRNDEGIFQWKSKVNWYFPYLNTQIWWVNNHEWLNTFKLVISQQYYPRGNDANDSNCYINSMYSIHKWFPAILVVIHFSSVGFSVNIQNGLTCEIAPFNQEDWQNHWFRMLILILSITICLWPFLSYRFVYLYWLNLFS